jgi:hypothetical protein
MILAKHLIAPLFAAVALILFTIPCAAQEPLLLLSANELTSTFFTPGNVDVRDLFKLAQNVHGRRIRIEEKGALGEPVLNIQSLGDSLLIYEDAAGAKRILSWCRQMDEAMQSNLPAPEASIVTEWRPGNISLMTAYQALETFERRVRHFDRGQLVSEHQNISILKEQGSMVLRDTQPNVDAMLSLLDRIDRPEQQLMITALVITGQRGGQRQDQSDIPAELARHLSKLVPYSSFTTQSLGMVRTSSQAETIEIELDDANKLRIRPEAFDLTASTLTALCRFDSDGGLKFETRTTVTAGEYTVLGASGTAPMFCVLRIELID